MRHGAARRATLRHGADDTDTDDTDTDDTDDDDTDDTEDAKGRTQ